jgi:hypothetical protein
VIADSSLNERIWGRRLDIDMCLDKQEARKPVMAGFWGARRAEGGLYFILFYVQNVF